MGHSLLHLGVARTTARRPAWRAQMGLGRQLQHFSTAPTPMWHQPQPTKEIAPPILASEEAACFFGLLLHPQYRRAIADRNREWCARPASGVTGNQTARAVHKYRWPCTLPAGMSMLPWTRSKHTGHTAGLELALSALPLWVSGSVRRGTAPLSSSHRQGRSSRHALGLSYGRSRSAASWGGEKSRTPRGPEVLPPQHSLHPPPPSPIHVRTITPHTAAVALRRGPPPWPSALRRDPL